MADARGLKPLGLLGRAGSSPALRTKFCSKKGNIMRCTQLIGLPVEAKQFLDENEKIDKKTCPSCGHTKAKRFNEEYRDASDQGMFDDGPIGQVSFE